MNEAPAYHHGNRYPLSATTNYNSGVQNHYRVSSNIQAPVKQDEYAHGTDDDALGNSGPNFFLGIPSTSTNPLFSQDRLFLNSYSHPTSHHQPASPLGFTAVNGSRERSYSAPLNQDPQHQPTRNIKLESQIGETFHTDRPSGNKEVGLNPESMWSGRGSEDDLAIREHLQAVALEL